MKKIISVILIITIVATLFASCKKEEAGESAKETTTVAQQAEKEVKPSEAPGILIGSEDHVELGKPDKYLDPESVYSKIEYTVDMFRGEYALPGGYEGKRNYKSSVSEYRDFTYEGEDLEISVIPYKVLFGETAISGAVPTYLKDYNWAVLFFYVNDEYEYDSYSPGVYCHYEIKDNKIVFKPLSDFQFNEEINNFDYTFADTTFEYEFAFSGRTLTLSAGGESITLTVGLDYYGNIDIDSYDYFAVPGEEIYPNIQSINIRYDEIDIEYNGVEVITVGYDESIRNAVAYLQEDGIITLTVPFESGTKTYQFVYICCGKDGWVFVDENNVYRYNLSIFDRDKYNTNKYTSDDQSEILENMTEEELEEIVEKKDNLLTDLADAFEAEGINVTINEEYGELVIDSSVIFGGDSAVLSADGKAFLNKFLKAYTSIVFSPEYEDFILKTVVEGHTAPVSGSTYESGLPLSEERAEVVRDYCISSETGVDTTKLANALEAVGYSNSKPIHDADGNVDMDASRRVSFKFIINLDA